MELNQYVIQYFSEVKRGVRYYVTAVQLSEMIRRGDPLFLMDVRDTEDYREGHIPNSINIPMEDIGDFFYQLPRDRKIIVICYTGQLAGQVVGILSSLGYEAYSLYGGMINGWQKAGKGIKG